MESHRVNSIISRRSSPLHCCTLTTLITCRDTKTKADYYSYYTAYQVFGPRVPDYGTVILYREIHLEMGFGDNFI